MAPVLGMSPLERPRFSLAYTTARPTWIPGVVDRWRERARSPAAVEVVIAVDAPDEDAARAMLGGAEPRPDSAPRLVVNRGPRTCVAGWNEAARATTGDVLIAVADDFDPPDHWDEALAAAAPGAWWRQDRVVAVADGNKPDVFTLAILTRPRYQRFGYLFHPAYASMYCDTEFTAVAQAEGVVIDARHLMFEHRHHDIGKRARDAVDRRQVSRERWRTGRALFAARRAAGFPAGPFSLPRSPVPAWLRNLWPWD